SVGEEEVDRVLGALRESVAQLRPVEDRNLVESGDVVTVDLTSRLDGGEPVHRDAVLLEAGGGSFPLALDNQLVGQNRGARLSLAVPYPPDHANPRLGGKTAQFEVELKALHAKELPPLDDEFARDHGRCSSLADLRAKVRSDLEREAAARADEAVGEAGGGQRVEPPRLAGRAAAVGGRAGWRVARPCRPPAAGPTARARST